MNIEIAMNNDGVDEGIATILFVLTYASTERIVLFYLVVAVVASSCHTPRQK